MTTVVALARHGWEPVVEVHCFSPDDPEPSSQVVERMLQVMFDGQSLDDGPDDGQALARGDQDVIVVDDDEYDLADPVYRLGHPEVAGLQIWGFSVTGKCGPSKTVPPHVGPCTATYVCSECGADCGTSSECPQCGHNVSGGHEADFHNSRMLKKLHGRAADVAGIFTR